MRAGLRLWLVGVVGRGRCVVSVLNFICVSGYGNLASDSRSICSAVVFEQRLVARIAAVIFSSITLFGLSLIRASRASVWLSRAFFAKIGSSLGEWRFCSGILVFFCLLLSNMVLNQFYIVCM